MKAVGVVRKIDDLGRLVIPKEIRRKLGIQFGDPLEVFTNANGDIFLQKHSPIKELGDFIKNYVEVIHEQLGHFVFVCDRDVYIHVAGVKQKDYTGHQISVLVDMALKKRVPTVNKVAGNATFIDGMYERLASYIIAPIVVDGDVLGGLVMASIDTTFGDVEIKTARVAAKFLGKHMSE